MSSYEDNDTVLEKIKIEKKGRAFRKYDQANKETEWKESDKVEWK